MNLPLNHCGWSLPFPHGGVSEEATISDGGKAPTSPRRLRWLAFLSGAFGLAMSAQVNFLVPLRARELGASFEIIGLLMAAGALAPALLSVPLGSVIDRLGPRRSFILSTGAAAVLASLYLFVTSYWWFFALQPLLGLARNTGWLASQSYVTSLGGTSEEKARFTGRFSFFGNGGQMVGPAMVGGVAQLVGFQWAFGFLAVYAAVFTVIGLVLAETRPPDHAQTRAKQGTGLRSALGLIVLRGIQVTLLLTFARLWVTWVYTTFFPVYLVETGLAPGIVGTVMATSGLAGTLLAPTAGFWARRFEHQTVASVGLACGATALLLAPHVPALPVVYVVPVLVGVGQGLSLPMLLSMITSAAPAEQRGVALGLRAMINQFAATAAPALVGPLIAALGLVMGFSAAGVVAAGLVCGSRLLHLADRRRDRAGREEKLH